MCIDENSFSAAGKPNAALNGAPHPALDSRPPAHAPRFLIDTLAIRNAPNSLKTKEGNPF
jgi:hypothetical protein